MAQDPTNTDKLSKLYSNLKKDGYDLPDEPIFKKDMADEKKREQLRSNLINDGYDLPEADQFAIDMGFKKKVDANTGPVYGAGSAPTPQSYGSKSSLAPSTAPLRAPEPAPRQVTKADKGAASFIGKYLPEAVSGASAEAVSSVLKQNGFDDDQVTELFQIAEAAKAGELKKKEGPKIPELEIPDSTAVRDETQIANVDKPGKFGKGYSPKEIENQDAAFEYAYKLAKWQAVKPRETKPDLVSSREDAEYLYFDGVSETVEKAAAKFNLSPYEKRVLHQRIRSTYEAEPSSQKARIAADMAFKSKYGATPFQINQYTEQKQKEAAETTQKEIDNLVSTTNAEIESYGKQVKDEVTKIQQMAEAESAGIFKKYQDAVDAGSMSPEQAQAAFTKERQVAVQKYEQEVKKAQNRYMNQFSEAKVRSEQRLTELATKEAGKGSVLTKAQMEEYGQMFSENFSSAEKKRMSDLENILRGKSYTEQTAIAFSLGLGDLWSSVGGALGMAGFDEASYKINRSVEKMGFNLGPSQVTAESIWDPSWWIANQVRTLPMMAALMPVGLGAGALTGRAASLVSKSKNFQAVASSVGGGAASWRVETYMEQALAYNDAIAQGKSPEEAAEIAADVGRLNLGTLPLQMMEMFPFFKKMPFSVGAAVSMTSGGVEELIQGYATNKAFANQEGREYTWKDYLEDPEAGVTFILGATMALPFAIAGGKAGKSEQQQRNALGGIVRNLVYQGSYAKASGVVQNAYLNGLIDEKTKADFDIVIDASVKVAGQTEAVVDPATRSAAEQAMIDAAILYSEAEAMPDGPVKEAKKAQAQAREAEVAGIVGQTAPIMTVQRKGDGAPTVMTPEAMDELLSNPEIVKSISDGDIDVTVKNMPDYETKLAEAIEKHRQKQELVNTPDVDSDMPESIDKVKGGEMVTYKGEEGTLIKDPDTGENVFVSNRGKETIISGGGDTSKMTDLGIESRKVGKVKDQGQEFYVVKQGGQPKVMVKTKQGRLAEAPFGKARKQAIIEKAKIKQPEGEKKKEDIPNQTRPTDLPEGIELLSDEEKANLPVSQQGKIVKGEDNRLSDLGVQIGDKVVNNYDGLLYTVTDIPGTKSKSGYDEYVLTGADGVERTESERPIFQKLEGKKPDATTEKKIVTDIETKNAIEQYGEIPSSELDISHALANGDRVFQSAYDGFDDEVYEVFSDQNLDPYDSYTIVRKENLPSVEGSGATPEPVSPAKVVKYTVDIDGDIVPVEVVQQTENGATIKLPNGGQTFRLNAELFDTEQEAAEYFEGDFLDLPTGNDGRFKFKDGLIESDEVWEDFEYTLIESDELQPSHNPDGTRNPNHSISSAQPKERNDQGSRAVQNKIAQNPDFKFVGENSSPYSGAPVINERGEVIQGNNRSIGLKMHYNQNDKSYKEQLAKEAGKFGFMEDQVLAMQNPILVRRVKVTDARAIELGQYDVKDLETGGKQRIDPVVTVRKMSAADKAALAEIAFPDEETTINAAIRNASQKAYQILKGYLNSAQLNTAFKDGALTLSGVSDIEAIAKALFFDGGDATLPTIFENVSGTARNTINGLLKNIFASPEGASLLPDFQNALLAVGQYMSSGADNFKLWAKQMDIETGGAPIEIYNPFELYLAEQIISPEKVKSADGKRSKLKLAQDLQNYNELTAGKPADMFAPEQKPISKEEAIKQTFNIDYNAIQEPSTEKVDVRQPSGDGQGVGQGDTGQQKPPGKDQQGSKPTKKEEDQGAHGEAKEEVDLPPADTRIDSETEDEIKKLFDKFRDLGGLASGFNPEAAAVAVQIVGVYVKKGVVKFADIMTNATRILGEKAKDYLDHMKRAYLAYMNEASDDVLDQMDDVKTVRNYTLTPKPKKDVPNTTGGSKGYSGNTGVDSPANQENVPSDRGSSRNDGDENSQGGRDQDQEQDGGQGSFDLFTPSIGKPSDKRLRTQDQGPGTEGADAGSYDGRGNSITGTTGSNDSNSGRGQDLSEGAKEVSETWHERVARVKEEQKKAENVEVIVGDENNIRESLPFLLPEQHDDVLKAEQRFFDPANKTKEKAFGKGMLFTNGTGTGKTYTGLGIVKRFLKQGKRNILIVVPTQPKVSDWIQDGSNLLIDISAIKDTRDAGKGVSITTYANFRENDALKNRDFDLIIYDESHRIMEDKKGEHSATTYAHYKHSNKNESWALQRLKDTNPLWIEERSLLPVVNPKNSEKYSAEQVRKANERLKEIRQLQSKELPEMEKRAESAANNTKVVFLSATPFKFHFNLRYVNGFLFDWGEEGAVNEKGSRIDAESLFYLQNFGSAYQWRYHRLESKPFPNAEAIAAQEIEFAESMRQSGAMSGRTIESNMDYGREFPKVTQFNSELFNKAFNDLFSFKDKDFISLGFIAHRVFKDYNYSTQLFESLKASMSKDRIQKHLDLGRKVVVFHRRRQSNVMPPFQSIYESAMVSANEVLDNPYSHEKSKEDARIKIQQAEKFKEKYQELFDYEQTLNYDPAVEQLAAQFPGKIAFINGSVSKKDKNKAIRDFNTDDSGIDIIVVQEEAGKEGISLHDTSGKRQRVLMSLSMPISTTTALQIEGRIYRIGQASNAIFEYPILGLDLETAYYGQNLNQRLATTENLAVGDDARDLIRSYAEGVLFNSTTDDPNVNQGAGGKEYDRRERTAKTPFQKAKLVYASNQKTGGRRDQRKGVDYYATPEPVGERMVAWADPRKNETMLEPSAGHGAIAMWAPKSNHLIAIEPSFDLYSKLSARSGGGSKKVINETFEDFSNVNKAHTVVMNPPFGVGGATAIKHLEKAFKHLYDNGRIVALLPDGPSMDKRLQDFLYGVDDKGKQSNPSAHIVAEIKLPRSTFEQAGTQVATKIVVIDKIPNPKEAPQSVFKRDFTGARSIGELFDAIETLEIPGRAVKESAVPVEQENKQSDATPPAPLKKGVESSVTEPVEYIHTNTKAKMGLVKMDGRQSKEVYAQLKEIATSMKYDGFYSPFAKGFLFPNIDKAKAFYAEVTKAAPSDPSKVEEAKAQFNNAIDDVKKAWKDLNGDGQNLGIMSADPDKAARDHYKLHMKLVDASMAAIKYGVVSMEAFASKLNLRVTKSLQLAWDDAKERLLGNPPIVSDYTYFLDKLGKHQQEVYEKQEEEYKKLQKATGKSLVKWFRQNFDDTRSSVRSFVEKLGGPDAFMLKVNVSGASQAANIFFRKKASKIFGGLSAAEETQLNGMIQAVRTIEIDEYREKLRDNEEARLIAEFTNKNGVAPTGDDLDVIKAKALRAVPIMSHPDGTNQFTSKSWLAEKEAENPELYKKLGERADEFFKAMRELLKSRLDQGQISQEAYDNMIHFNYAKRVFLGHLYDNITEGVSVKSGKGSTVVNDIKNLKDGDIDSLFNHARYLLMATTNSTYQSLANNQANRALYNLIEANPGNPKAFVQKPIGTDQNGNLTYPPAPHGFTQLYSFHDGVKKAMALENDLAEEWIGLSPYIDQVWGNVIRVATGGSLLRAFATGVANQFFFLTNLPRDTFYNTFFTNTYGPSFTLGFLKQARQMLRVAPDVFLRGTYNPSKSQYNKAIDQGLMMNFLAQQGRGILSSDLKISKTSMAWESLQNAFEYLSVSFEMIPRMALRQQEMDNRISALESRLGRKLDPLNANDAIMIDEIERIANGRARDVIDFSQGGRAVKALDTAIPYANAATLAFRNATKFSVKNPGKAGFRTAELAGWTTALMMYTLGAYEDDYENDISDDEKARYWIIMLPFTKIDETTGERVRYYFAIAKSQEIAPIAAVTEEAYNYQKTGKFNWKKVGRAFDTATPPYLDLKLNDPTLDPVQNIARVGVSMIGSVPAVGAYMAMEANYDSFTKEKIWKGNDKIYNWLKYTEGKTQKMFIDLGKRYNISPDQMKRGVGKIVTDVDRSFWSSGILYGYDVITNAMTPEEKQEFDDAAVTGMGKAIGAPLKRILRTTRPGINDTHLDQLSEALQAQESMSYLRSKEKKKYLEAFKRGEPLKIYARSKREISTMINDAIRTQLDWDTEKKMLMQLHVENGMRAQYIYQRMKEFDNQEAANKWMNELIIGGAITKRVWGQIQMIGLIESQLTETENKNP